jgi:hypothetical protein
VANLARKIERSGGREIVVKTREHEVRNTGGELRTESEGEQNRWQQEPNVKGGDRPRWSEDEKGQQ